MTSPPNRQVRLAARPVGTPKPSDWEHVEATARAPAGGEFAVEVLYISIDPAMRGWMDDLRSYLPPVGIGEVMRATALGRVTSSSHAGFVDGELVTGLFGVQEQAISDGRGVMKVDPTLAPPPTHLGALGLSGITAYFGLLEVGRARPGDTVVVSGAAGSVGSVVGQIARATGCRVIGIAGGEAKCRWLVDELGFDAAIDYKTEPVGRALRRHAPAGVDVYFDNVGGETLDDVLGRLALGARVVLCGAISQYNGTGAVKGPAKYLSLLVNRASMTGMLVFDYADRYQEAVGALADLLGDGALTPREHIVRGGVERFPEALLQLFSGANLGKLVLAVSANDGEPA